MFEPHSFIGCMVHCSFSGMSGVIVGWNGCCWELEVNGEVRPMFHLGVHLTGTRLFSGAGSLGVF